MPLDFFLEYDRKEAIYYFIRSYVFLVPCMSAVGNEALSFGTLFILPQQKTEEGRLSNNELPNARISIVFV